MYYILRVYLYVIAWEGYIMYPYTLCIYILYIYICIAWIEKGSSHISKRNNLIFSDVESRQFRATIPCRDLHGQLVEMWPSTCKKWRTGFRFFVLESVPEIWFEHEIFVMSHLQETLVFTVLLNACELERRKQMIYSWYNPFRRYVLGWWLCILCIHVHTCTCIQEFIN